MDINDLIFELQSRRNGYLFGGPCKEWCANSTKKKDGNTETNGCIKFKLCSNHKNENCYSKTLKDGEWDKTHFTQRESEKWIGNPFGVRHNPLSDKNGNSGNWADFNPCPDCGCVTPEMQKTYESDLNGNAQQDENYWRDFKPCPYYYKAKDEHLTEFEKNISRFAQCFVTQNEVKSLLKSNGFVAAGSLFRDPISRYDKDKSDIFWYPFFSGYSYIQLPFLVDESDPGWKEFAPQMRWHATTIQRNNTYTNDVISDKLSYTDKVFLYCEEIDIDALPRKYHEQRFLDINEGYASWLLITWILLQRQFNINNTTWIYSEDCNLYNKLKNFGYEDGLNKIKLSIVNNKVQRNSSFMEDLQLLGIIDHKQQPTLKFTYLINWLCKDNKYHKKEIGELLGGIKSKMNSGMDLFAFIELSVCYHKKLLFEKKNHTNLDKFNNLLILNPTVQIIVRAFLQNPIRWFFIPFNSDFVNNKLTDKKDKTTVKSGMILLLQDSLKSKAYNPEIVDGKNIILKRIKALLPFLEMVNSIEEQNIRDEEERKNKELEKEKQKSNTRAAISQLYARTDAHDLGHVLDAFKSDNDIEKNEANGQYQYYEHQNDGLNPQLKEFLSSKNKLIGYFNQMLQNRMVFRADVATTDPNSLTTLDFYQDIFIPFNNNLIFNHRVSGIGDTDLKYKFIVKHNTKINKDVKIKVGFPNDVLGCQAMYLIWSNVIRNTVKHGDLTKSEKENLAFTIEIEEYLENKQYYEVKLYSNVFRSNRENGINELVTKRNKAFHDSILDKETNRLRSNNLGSIEMDTCAAYLRKLPVTDVENEEYDLFDGDGNARERSFEKAGVKIPVIMYAYAQPENEADKKALGYKFYLLKPKEILYVHHGEVNLENEIKEMLLKSGIELIAEDEFRKLTQTTFEHNFLVFTNKEQIIQNALNNFLLSNLPKRKIFDYKIDLSDDPVVIIDKIWNKWSNRFCDVELYNMESDDGIGKVDPFYKSSRLNNANLKIRLYNHDTKLEAEGNDKPTCLQNGDYHEMRCGHHWAKQNIHLVSEAWITLYSTHFQYLESVFAKVLILDERIQRSIVLSEKRYSGRIPFTEYFRQQGIFIPDPDSKSDKGPDLNKTELYKAKNEINKYITKHAAMMDFIVIHLGILEKLLRDKSDHKSEEKISSVIEDIVPEKLQTKIIITSGRGKPNNVNEKYSFVPVSLMQNAIDTLFDKYRLVQLLYNSRKSIH